MKRFDLLSRCLGLLLAVGLAMPAETSASFVTGGELPDCSDTEIINPYCTSNEDFQCLGTKPQCVGCGHGHKTFIGKVGGPVCNYSTVACTSGQRKCLDSGQICRVQNCP